MTDHSLIDKPHKHICVNVCVYRQVISGRGVSRGITESPGMFALKINKYINSLLRSCMLSCFTLNGAFFFITVFF